MGGIVDALAPVIQLLLFIAYGFYSFLGLVLLAGGIYYLSQVTDANSFAGAVCCGCGFLMLVVGAGAIYANLNKIWLIMAIILFIDVFLVVLLLAAMMVGMAIINEVTDPVSKAVFEAYCDKPGTGSDYCQRAGGWTPDNPGIIVRQSAWNGVVELIGSGAPGSCKAFDSSMRDEPFQTVVGGGRPESCTRIETDADWIDADAIPAAEELVTAATGDRTAAAETAMQDSALLATGLRQRRTLMCESVPDLVTADQLATCTFTAVGNVGAGTPAACAATSGLGACTVNGAGDDCDMDDGASDASCAGTGPEAATCALTTDSTACTGDVAAVTAGSTSAAVPADPPADVAATVCAFTAAVVPADATVCAFTPAVAGTAPPATCAVEATVCAFTAADTTDPTAPTAASCAITSGPGDCAVTAFVGAVTAGTTTAAVAASCAVDGAGTGTCTVNGLSCDATVTDPVTTCTFTAAVDVVPATGCDGSIAVAGVTLAQACVSNEFAGNCSYSNGVESGGGHMFGDAVGIICQNDAVATPATAATCVVDNQAAGNCTMIRDVLGSGTEYECKNCWADWQNYKVTQIKGNMWPATIAIWALFLFVVILVCINNVMIATDDGESWEGVEGILKIVGFVFNGLVLLMGMLTMIGGIVAHVDLTDGCPAGGDCSNWAVYGVITLGIFFFLVAIMSVVGLVLGNAIGKLLIRVADLIFVLMSLLLMIMGIGFVIVAGAMDDINAKYADNFPAVRAQYESEQPGFCGGPGYTPVVPLEDPACRAKIKAEAESSMTTIAVILGIVCFSFIFIIYLTFQAVFIYKDGDGDDDDDDDDDE